MFAVKRAFWKCLRIGELFGGKRSERASSSRGGYLYVLGKQLGIEFLGSVERSELVLPVMEFG